MDENLTDQQRAEQIRTWLGENGWYLLAGLALGLAALFGYRQYTGANLAQAEKASALYDELLGAVRVQRASRAEEIAAQLAADYKSTPYADQARLAMAKLKLEQGAPDQAVQYLRQVADDTGNAEIADIARLRLGRVLAQQEKYDEALKVLTPPKESALAARYHDARGDVYYLMGRMSDAATEYGEALTAGDSGIVDTAFVRAKLDQVSGAPAPTAAAPPATATVAPAPAP